MARQPVFSHEELVCKMAADPDSLDLNLAKAVYDELKAIVSRETKRRTDLIEQVYENLFSKMLYLAWASSKVHQNPWNST